MSARPSSPSFALSRSILLAVGLASLTAACQKSAEIAEPESARRALAVLSPGFQEVALWRGLDKPTAVRFAPDGRIFVAEKRGRIQVFDNLADATPTEFARLDTNVHDFWDRGLLGLALHPQFPAQPYVYVLYSLDAPVGGTPPVWADKCPEPPGATNNGCVIGARLSRLEAAGNTSTGGETILIESWGQQFPSHSIGDLAFGADGALYVTGGDGASFTFVDYGQRGTPRNPLGDPPVAVGGIQTPPDAAGGALRSQSLRRSNGPVLLNGALLRLDPMTGAAMPDNPLIGNADTNAQRIIAYGLRNPFRFTTRPGTSEIWIADVGGSTWEELNRVVNPIDAVVENFGWPCYEGRAKQGGYDGANLALCESLYAQASAVTMPLLTYNHGAKVVPGEECKVGDSSITALSFYTGDKFPPKYKNALFLADYSRDCAWVMLPGADGVPDPAKIETFGNGVANIVDLQMGPDGNLYYANLVDGEIRRISYLLPRAVATASPVTGIPPLVVNFDGSASIKPLVDDTLTFAWDLDGDGDFDDAAEEKTSFIYEATGNVQVRLRVIDQRGVSSTSDPIAISVSSMPMVSTPPVPVIDTPAEGLGWKVGDTITFSGHATDVEDGNLPASSLSWLLVMEHCPAGCHSHVIQTFPGTANGTFASPDHEFPSHIDLVLVAVDSSGIRRTATRRLDPQTTFITLQSQPSGLELALGLDEGKAPFGREFIFNGQISVGAPIVQTVADVPYAFVSWSDGQPASHDVGPLLAPQILTATYRPAGLTAEYFDDMDLVESRVLRIDPDVNFDWGRSSPDPLVDPTQWSARWTGFVQPQFSERYTFATDSDDGVRVWVNDLLVLDAWNVHSARRDSATPVMLTAGQKAKIRMEFFDDAADAVAKLYWSSPSQPLAIVPTGRLYPACVAGVCPNGFSCANGECVSQCAAACGSGQRCDGHLCVDACQGITCETGKCVAGACVPKCQGVSCAAESVCVRDTGLCKPECAVNGCPATEMCNSSSGACVPKCQGVTCEAGFACAPMTGMCADNCLAMECPGQICQAGECRPLCVVRGCSATQNCNATSGVCEGKCAAITCAPGNACVPTTGQCEPLCTQPPCADASAGPDDAADPVDSGVEDAPVAVADAGAIDAVSEGDAGDGSGAAAGDAAGVDVIGIQRAGSRGGCGCDVGGGGRQDAGAAIALSALVLVLIGVRRRRRYPQAAD
jgi:glucose/arabinose dehydrogenase